MPSGTVAKVYRNHVGIGPPARKGAAIDQRPTASICLACGVNLPLALDRSASLRCHDCRDARAPLRAELVEPPRALPARRRLRLRPAA